MDLRSPSSEDSLQSLGPELSSNRTSLSSCVSIGPAPVDDRHCKPMSESSVPTSPSRTSTYAKSILQREAAALLAAADKFETSEVFEDAFEKALEAIQQLGLRNGRLVLAGIGKSALLAKKAAATFCSLGIPALFLDPVAALHGDLGVLSPNGSDVAILISYSGSTHEVLQLMLSIQSRCHSIMALTGSGTSPLARAADVWLDAGIGGDGLEADPTLPAPTSSLVVSMGLLDALALAVLRSKTGWDAPPVFNRDLFAWNHPGGSLGLQLAK